MVEHFFHHFKKDKLETVQQEFKVTRLNIKTVVGEISTVVIHIYANYHIYDCTSIKLIVYPYKYSQTSLIETHW